DNGGIGICVYSTHLDPHKLSPHALLKQLCLGPFILNVSNYYPEKGQETVFRAYYASCSQIPLVFVGSLNNGHTLDQLKAIKTHELDQTYGFKEVLFFYDIPRTEVLRLAQHATLFLHASIGSYESFPMVLLESMQFATPFVCTPVGNALELMPELVVQGVPQMAEKINALLGDPSYYAQISQKLHTLVQNFTYEKILEKMLA
uniref:glycosyltransferase family 4 protein n=1 Tax=Helicobacter felis TaxID=214 RepID=UPI001F09221B